MPWIAIIPAALGVYQTIAGSSKAKKLQSQIKPYQEAPETESAVQLAQNLAQGGFSPEAMQYLTQQTERASSNALNAVNRAGGTPNDINNILDIELQNFMKIGAQDSMQQFQNFDRLLNAWSGKVQARDAAWADERALLKDQMAQAAQQKAQGIQNIGSGIQSGLNLYANQKQMDLYKEDISSRNTMWQNMFKESQLPSVQQYGMIGPQQEVSITNPETPYYLAPRNYRTAQQQQDDFINRWQLAYGNN